MNELFFTNIWTRIHKKNKNYLAMVCGPTGSGKSYAAMTMCEMLDKGFNIDRVVFSADEFLQLLNEEDLKRGDFILWDEAGVGLASREWMSQRNIQMGKIAQTFRHRNLGVYFTVPSIDFVDIQFRKLAHSVYTTSHINRWTKTCMLKHYILQNNPILKKIYTKREDLHDREKNVKKVTSVVVKLPSEGLRHKYDTKKDEFTDKLNRAGPESGPKEIAKDILKNHRDLIKKNTRGNYKITIPTIARLYSPKARDVAIIKQIVESEFNGQ